MGSGSTQRRLSHSFHQSSSTLSFPNTLRELFSQLGERKSLGGGDTVSFKKVSGGVGVTRTGILQPHLCGAQSYGRVSSGNRSFEPKSVHPQDKVPNGDKFVGYVDNSKRRLDVVSRSPRSQISVHQESRKCHSFVWGIKLFSLKCFA